MSANEPMGTYEPSGANEPAEANQPVMGVLPATAETRPPEPNLTEEFREFGRQLSALLRAVRESPRAKDVETQVTQAMRDMERQVNEAMENARLRAQAADWRQTLKGAATTAADETQRGLARGLHAVNQRMAKTVQEAEKNRAQTAGGSSGFGGEVPEVPAAPEPSPVVEAAPPTDFTPPTTQP